MLLLLLQEKRSAFPRFYFIGDDDLLEILGQATNPTVIQSHLKKLFAGENSVFCSTSSNLVFFFFVKHCIYFSLMKHGFYQAFPCTVCVGIHSVVFDEPCRSIVAMCSLEGETVPLRNHVHISSNVEVKQFGVPSLLHFRIFDVTRYCFFFFCYLSLKQKVFADLVKGAVGGNEGDSEAAVA